VVLRHEKVGVVADARREAHLYVSLTDTMANH
jgi:hypothetical protein